MKYVTGMGCVWGSPEHNEIEALRRRVVELQRQFAKVTRVRDALRAMLAVADARINRLVGNPK